MSSFDPIRKDFKFQMGGKTGKALKALNWFRKKINKPPIILGGRHRGKETTVFLNAFKPYMDNPNFSEERVVDLLSDVLTHEYLHKITMEDPVFAKEWQEWKKANSSNPISGKIKDINAQELVANGMMDNQMKALRDMSEHFAVDDKIREAASKVFQDISRQAKENSMKTNQWAKENGINPRLKMWEFLEASNKDANVKKSDDNFLWFDVLKRK